MPAPPQNHAALQEVSSTVYPKLERVPGKQNWVDKAGGLPEYIERIAKHLHYEQGKSISTAIAMAVNTVKRWATGTNHNGSKLKPDTVAKAQAAVAEWEAKKGKAKGKSLAEAYAEAPEGLEPDADARALMAGAFAHRLALAEGMAMTLKGRKTAGKAVAVANAKALLEGKAAKLKLGAGNADPRELSSIQSALGIEITELRSTVGALNEALGAPPVFPQAKAAQRDARRQPQAKNRNGQAVFDETKHPRAGKGQPTGGQFVRKGSTGGEVKGIQRSLGVKADGRFGNRTKKAVEDFQRKHGLTVDGVVGAQTAGALRGTRAAPGPLLSHHHGALRKLKTDSAARFTSAATAAADEAEKAKNKARKARKEAKKDAESKSSSSSSDSSTSDGPGSTLGPDSSLPSNVVELLQRQLGIKATGDYDDATEKAIRKFQRENGLLVDGIVGTQTLAALRGDDSPPSPGAFTQSDWEWLTQNQSGGQREHRQKRQKAKREERQQTREEKREERELSSRRVAEAMVKDDFVRRYGAGMTGSPDEATAHLQRRLSELGYDAGPDDGRYGDKTKGAVEGFQADHGLKADGQVGHDTKVALRGTDPEEVSRRQSKNDQKSDQKSAEKSDSKTEVDDEEAEGEDAEAAEAEEAEEPSRHSLAGAVLTKGAGVDSEEPDPSVETMQSIIGSEVDGRFGPDTEKKLKSTQRRYGLKADGVVGPKTGRLLDRMASKHKPDPKKMEESALDAAILDRMEAAASGDTVAFTRARAREELARHHLEEASLRGLGIGNSLREFYRLSDGTFAPKGRGTILRPGEKISIPHSSGKGTVAASIERGDKGRGLARLTDGPDKGQLASVRTAAPQGLSPRPFPDRLRRRPTSLPPGNPESGASVQEVKSQNYRDAIAHHISAGEDHAVQDNLDDMASDHEWAERQGYGKATANYDAAREMGERFLHTGEKPDDMEPKETPQFAPIDFSTKSDAQLDELADSVMDSSTGLPRSNVRDRSIFQAVMGERKRRAMRDYREAKGESARSRAADFVAQLTGKRPQGAPVPAQAAPPEGFEPNASEVQLKDMKPGDTFYVGKHDEAYAFHKAVDNGFIIAKPVDGGKAKPFHELYAPPFIGPESEAEAPPAPTPSPAEEDDLFEKLQASLEPGGKKSPARSPSGNLRNFKAMSDKKLTGLAEEMSDHSYDTAAIQAITAELQKRASDADEPVPINPITPKEKGHPIPPKPGDELTPENEKLAQQIASSAPDTASGKEAMDFLLKAPPKTAEPAVNKSTEEKVAAAWGAYETKKADFDALPADADKATRSKLAAQVRAAKFRIKRVGGDPEKPPQKAEPPKPKPKAPKAKAAPKKAAKPKAAPKAEPEESFEDLVAAGVKKEHAAKAEAVAGKAAHKLGKPWDAATVSAALDRLEQSGLNFDREKESPDTFVAVIKAAGLDPAQLKTIGTV